MDKIQKLLTENWSMLDELFELPKNVDTTSYGDDFYKRGEYGDSFEFHHPVKGKSGNTYNMVFRFFKRNLITHNDNTRTHNVPSKNGQKEVAIAEKFIPVYEVSFYPEKNEGTEKQWAILNDIDPTHVTTVNGYFMLYHASTLLQKDVPSPFVDYIFRPYKEKHEKDLDAKSSKRGEFYNRAIPKIIGSIAQNFGNVEVTEVKIEPEYTLIKVKKA